MKLDVPQNAGYVLSRLGNVTFSRRSLFHGSYIPCPVLSTFTVQAIFLPARCTDLYFYDNTEKMLFLRTVLTFHGFHARNNSSRGGSVCSSQTSLNYMTQAYFSWSSKELNKIVLSLGLESDVSKEAEASTLRIKLFWWMRQQVSPKRQEKCAYWKSSSYKAELVMVTGMRTTNPTKKYMFFQKKKTYVKSKAVWRIYQSKLDV